MRFAIALVLLLAPLVQAEEQDIAALRKQMEMAGAASLKAARAYNEAKADGASEKKLAALWKTLETRRDKFKALSEQVHAVEADKFLASLPPDDPRRDPMGYIRARPKLLNAFAAEPEEWKIKIRIAASEIRSGRLQSVERELMGDPRIATMYTTYFPYMCRTP